MSQSNGERDPSPHYDLDVFSGEVEWGDLCECGHERRNHAAATGALGSFGGSACEHCWECPTFRRVDSGTEVCVWCGERQGRDAFEDGLRCKLCAEAQDEDARK